MKPTPEQIERATRALFGETSYERLGPGPRRDVAAIAQALAKVEAEAWLAGNAAINPCQKIFDHKYLNPDCVEKGCQVKLLADELAAAMPAVTALIEAAESLRDNAKNSDHIKDAVVIEGDDYRAVSRALNDPALARARKEE